jgi:hypothetical protein
MPATVIDPETKCRPLDLVRGLQAMAIYGGRALAAQSGSFLNRVKLIVFCFVEAVPFRRLRNQTALSVPDDHLGFLGLISRAVPRLVSPTDFSLQPRRLGTQCLDVTVIDFAII